MKGSLRRSMAFLHTWCGLLLGPVLFAVFLTGTASYLRPEITRWMRPEVAPGAVGGAEAALAAAAELQRIAPQSQSWYFNLAGDRDPVTLAYWRGTAAQGRALQLASLDGRTGAVLADRESRGGEFFYRFHFQLYYLPIAWGRWVVAIAASFMLVAIISGIVIHKRIFADLFTFRPRKGQRSWLDGHAVAAVLALPFHLMITYTGLVTLMVMTLPWGIGLLYPSPGGPAAFFADTGGGFVPLPPAGKPGALADLRPMVELAVREWGGTAPARMNLLNPGDANATVLLYSDGGERLSSSGQGIAYRGADGTVLARWGETASARQVRDVMVGLHAARFAEPLLRALFLLAGFAGTAMVGTGLVLWSVARRRKDGPAHLGHRLVEVLNVATVAGMPFAMAAFFWGNRLLPLRLAERAEWEIHLFFIAWGASLLHALLRPRRLAWTEQFRAGAALLLLLPLGNALLTDRGLDHSIAAGDWGMAGFDLGLLGLGMGLAMLAWASAPERRRRERARLPMKAVSDPAE